MSLVPASKKIPAGVLGILFGSFGIHKFVMGFPRAGMTMLGLTVLFRVLAWIHVPGAWTLATAVTVFAFIEGIIYLTKNDTDWYRDYEINKKEWL